MFLFTQSEGVCDGLPPKLLEALPGEASQGADLHHHLVVVVRLRHVGPGVLQVLLVEGVQRLPGGLGTILAGRVGILQGAKLIIPRNILSGLLGLLNYAETRLPHTFPDDE